MNTNAAVINSRGVVSPYGRSEEGYTIGVLFDTAAINTYNLRMSETETTQTAANDETVDTLELIIPEEQAFQQLLERITAMNDPIEAMHAIREINLDMIPEDQLEAFAHLIVDTVKDLKSRGLYVEDREIAELAGIAGELTSEHFVSAFILDAYYDHRIDIQPFIVNLIAYRDLGLDVEFFNAGPNAQDMPEPDIKINRHPIERHFAEQRLKPPQFIQPFAGTPYGP